MGQNIQLRVKNLVSKKSEFKEVELTSDEVITFGRSAADVTIHLDDPNVSRVHASLQLVDNQIEIKDLESHNGIKIEGLKVPTAILNLGNSVVIGVFKITVTKIGNQEVKVIKKEMPIIKAGGRNKKSKSDLPKTPKIANDSNALMFYLNLIKDRFLAIKEEPLTFLETSTPNVFAKTEIILISILSVIAVLPLFIYNIIFLNIYGLIMAIPALGVAIAQSVLFAIVLDKTKNKTSVQGDFEDYIHFSSNLAFYTSPLILIANLFSVLPFVNKLAEVFMVIMMLISLYGMYVFFVRYKPNLVQYIIVVVIYAVIIGIIQWVLKYLIDYLASPFKPDVPTTIENVPTPKVIKPKVL